MMRKRSRRVMMLFFFWILSSVLLPPSQAASQEVPLKYISWADAPMTSNPAPLRALEKSLEPPDGWDLPRLKSEFPVYVLLSLGEEQRLLILDQANEEDLFFNVVYFDANGNKDLRDDPVIQAETGSDELIFRVEDFRLKTEEGTYPYAFRLHAEYKGRRGKRPSRSAVERSLFLSLEPYGAYRGDLERNGSHASLLVVDRNGNGRFGDPAQAPEMDAIAAGEKVEMQGDGLLIANSGETMSSFVLPFGNLLVMGDETMEVKVDMASPRLLIESCDAATARVTLPMEADLIGFHDAAAGRTVMLYKPAREVKLPAGRYRLCAYRTLRKDAQGDLWALEAAATRETPEMAFTEAATASYPFGEPYRTRAQVPQWSIDGVKAGYSEQANIEFTVEGAGGERVTDFLRVSGSATKTPLSSESKERPAEPRFRVFSSDGNLAAEGQFKYG